MNFRIFRDLFQASDERGSRSTALKSINWTLSLLVAALLLRVSAKHFFTSIPDWIPIFIAALLAVDFIAFIFLNIYFSTTGKIDALRSERHVERRLEIENRLVGDSSAGMTITPIYPSVPGGSVPALTDIREQDSEQQLPSPGSNPEQ
jgi:hypothetical protein